ncbi:MAG TPA: hypothetical protein VK191_12350 [Symbiobacteriaceae bacterium]|nr:hypothetical protein [Symbiobacteriaceae bacterium]
MSGLLALCLLALGPALVALLPPSLLPEALRATRQESTVMHRTLSVARASILLLSIVAVIQGCASVLANDLPW